MEVFLMAAILNNQFTTFEDLEEVSIVELKGGDEILGGVTIVADSEWNYEEFRVRWDLLITKGYSISTNYARGTYEWTEIVHQDDERTIIILHHEEYEDYKELKEARGPQDWGWGEWFSEEVTKLIIVKHDNLDRIIAQIAFRRQFVDEIEEMEYYFFYEDKELSLYGGLEGEEIEDLEELEEIGEKFFQHCEECSHPLGHLFEDQCPCGYKEQ